MRRYEEGGYKVRRYEGGCGYKVRRYEGGVGTK